MGRLQGRTVFITGASRGIGKALAILAGSEGANVAIAAKTAQPHPKLPGTIYTAADEVCAAGGKALPLIVDVRDEAAVAAALAETAQMFGGIDIVVNNASAIALVGTEELAMKRYDLMHAINARGTFMTSKLAIPYLRRSSNPHVLAMAPPLDMSAKWFKPYTAYTMAKYGMSMVVLGLAEEFRDEGIAFNALWPRTAVATAAVEFEGGGASVFAASRTPAIMAEAALEIITRPAREFSGNFCMDDTILYQAGVTDFERFRHDAAVLLSPDIFVPETDVPPPGVAETIAPRSPLNLH